jgi:uncharacterized phage-associated protein
MQLSRTDLLLQLLADLPTGKSSGAVQGITRLQKLLFLAEREAGVTVGEGTDFNFTAYKFGPVSKDLYDDLEKLENLGLIETHGIAEPSTAERDEYGLSFEGLMGEEEQESAEVFEERRYAITEQGLNWLKARASAMGDEVRKGIRRVKGKYGSISLSDLLYYVYTRYPEMTSESEIRERVLNR